MRIGIASHSQRATALLQDIVTSVPAHSIAWTTRTGTETVKRCMQDTPDLILMSLGMPDMDGAAATKQIMGLCPCAVLLIAGSLDGDRAKLFEAMGHGALDAISAPLSGHDATARSSQSALLKKIHTIQKLKWNPMPADTYRHAHTAANTPLPSLVVIGSSTGGPKALAKILSDLPATFNAGIVIAQHVGDEFSKGMVDWLNDQTPLSVQLAVQGAKPTPGVVFMGGSKQHLIITKYLSIGLTDRPAGLYFRPSVDLFFESVAKHWPMQGIAVLLTGMGRDGAVGLASLRKRGWHTIAQDEATSVVYGMPKAAKELKAAAQILPVDNIALELIRVSRQPQHKRYDLVG